MANWKYVSQNTLDYIYLHDCDCERIFYDNDTVVMRMEWMPKISHLLH
ncbi:MAG: hypothetical protein HFF02_05520 [Erysipelotrichaceae bacterium]|nr:hypothetical protein [Erysipelotrichaceae bacterium]